MTPRTAQADSGEARRLEAATEWLLRLRDDAASEQDILRWVQWCESDPRNQHAYERAEALWRISGGLAGEVSQGELRCPRRGLVPRMRSALISGRYGLRKSLREHRPSMAIAMLLVAVIAGGGAWNLRGALQWPLTDDNALIAAAVAESVHHAQLSDGSRIQLAAKSTVAVQYTPQERSLELQGGEAYFTVAPNSQRPFVVTVGDIRVRAVGTAFNIRRAGERIVVTVAEGTVDVYQAGAGMAASTISERGLRVTAGGEVAWDARATQAPVMAAVDPAEALAWREGRLEYTDEPLAAVIADFNRYSKRPAVISTEAIGHLRFSGTLLTNVTNEWLHALPRLFPVTVREQDGAYIIEPRNALRG